MRKHTVLDAEGIVYAADNRVRRKPAVGVGVPIYTTVACTCLPVDSDMSQYFLQRISQLMPYDNVQLSKFLLADPPEYNKFFHPFDFDSVTITEVLSKNKHWGVFDDRNELMCYFTLRGFSEKWESPSFGVYVGEKFAGKGLAGIACQFVISWLRLAQFPRLYLKVHPDNPARHVYEKCGFRKCGEKNGEWEYQYLLNGD